MRPTRSNPDRGTRRARGAAPKLIAALLAFGLLFAFALLLALFNLISAPLILPNYLANPLGRELLLQAPFTMSRTYTVELHCAAQPTRRSFTVKAWGHRSAGEHALSKQPECERVLTVDRWRKRGRG